jgi:hypothetical protein
VVVGRSRLDSAEPYFRMGAVTFNNQLDRFAEGGSTHRLFELDKKIVQRPASLLSAKGDPRNNNP